MGSGKSSNVPIEDINELYPHGALFRVDLTQLTDGLGQPISPVKHSLGHLVIKGKNPNGSRRQLSILGLPKARYEVSLVPLPKPLGESPHTLSDNGSFTLVETGLDLGNGPVRLGFEKGPDLDEGDLDDLLDYQRRKRSVSSEGGAPIKVTAINEVVEANPSYPNVALVGVAIQASSRIQTSPELALLISKGRVIRQHEAAGVADAASSGTVLVDSGADFSQVTTGLSILRNLDTHQEAVILNKGANTLYTGVGLGWIEGHRYLVYSRGSSNLFPDIFVDTLTNPSGGLGHYIEADLFIDYESICRSRAFCLANSLYWDGVISEAVEWGSWVLEQSSSSLLYPTRIDGRFGLLPEDSGAIPTALFNESNILKGTYEEEYLSWQETAVEKVVVTFRDGADGRMSPRSLTIVTKEANLRPNLKPVEESIRLDGVTLQSQAIKVGMAYLQSKRRQNRAVRFKTGTEALFLMPGDIILVQHRNTEVIGESSGFVIQSQPPGPSSQRVKLTRMPRPDINPADYRVATLHRSAPEGISPVQTDLEFSLVEGWMEILTELELGIGDPVVVTLATTFDRAYRVQSVSFDQAGQAQITAVVWNPIDLDNLESHPDYDILL